MSGEPVWEPAKVAAYMANSLSKVPAECEWPDDMRGNAARFLIQDLGEFAETMVAAASAAYWSPAKALSRLFTERIEVLMGAQASESRA